MGLQFGGLRERKAKTQLLLGLKIYRCHNSPLDTRLRVGHKHSLTLIALFAEKFNVTSPPSFESTFDLSHTIWKMKHFPGKIH